MEESILNTIKKLCGISADDESFDLDMIVFINSALSSLTQIGVGPANGLSIEDSSACWSDITDELKYEDVKTYVYLKVRLLFDPPSSSIILESLQNTLKEIEWRLYILKDNENQ